MRLPNGAYQSVGAEILIMGILIAADIAAVSPILASRIIFCGKSLVYPVPNETALHVGRRNDNIEIFLKIAAAVSHCVRKFAHDERTGNIRSFRIPFHVSDTRIHGTNNVGIPVFPGLFVLNGTAVVPCLYPVVHCVKGFAVAGFVSQRPNNDGWMIFIPFY